MYLAEVLPLPTPCRPSSRLAQKTGLNHRGLLKMPICSTFSKARSQLYQNRSLQVNSTTYLFSTIFDFRIYKTLSYDLITYFQICNLQNVFLHESDSAEFRKFAHVTMSLSRSFHVYLLHITPAFRHIHFVDFSELFRIHTRSSCECQGFEKID